MLDLPMKEDPGMRFEYCNGATYLLSAILQKSTGMRSLEFAMDNLFTPLGIEDVKWETNSQGIDVGYGGMWLKPHDMARFGWLFLRNGKWKDKTIVSEKWVKRATAGHVDATIFDEYGYQWWTDNTGYYAAVGYGGQRIFIVPEHDLVAVFTSLKSFTKADRLIQNYIIKSIGSDEPLSSNNSAKSRLNQLVEKCNAPPKSTAVKEMPPLAKTISGKIYKIEANQEGFTDFTFTFGLKEKTALFEYGLNNERYAVEIGLDGIYRITDQHGEKLAIKGEWLNQDSFRFTSVNVGHTQGSSGVIKFIEKKALISIIGMTPSLIRLNGVRE